MPSTVTSRRRQLGNEIRRARVAAGKTQQAVAQLLGCSQGKINKIESGIVAVKNTELKRMLEAFGTGKAEADVMLDLARSSTSPRSQWSGYRSAVPQWFRTFTDLEPAAAEILSWHGERIPGPLQSEHYMLTQFSEDRATDVTALVRNRLDRRQVFDLPRPPYYRFILSEAAFHRMPGGPNPSVALDQVEHLLDLQQRYPRAYVHVLPFGVRLPYVPNDFTMMRFSDGTKDFVFVEHVAGGLYLDDEDDFDLFNDAWDRLRGAAMERHDTVEFLQHLADQFRAQVTF
ncbi:helix-turn-helix domain-containing protein [Saccharopolyspora sp. K220]|uniref:helix-turn-helix domain-containing protein n=1 Tax=Saccharopolyspora soli TaxID=2926618 RepID=UPI001F55CA93|nr:helix-turn-helix transcriptional regulator [Saccharopolyspora soli]MCI2420610.1 helix-turn-helix domain-containing protein [Saccharopolyspora soli]